PLAGWLGRATEALARHVGEGIGGLLNATFGNAAELIIAVMALREGLTPMVKASLTGSILGNMLLVLGVAMLTGGLRRSRQEFNSAGARIQATLLMLAVVALVLPAAFHHMAGPEIAWERDLSRDISWVLLLSYGAMLVFTLWTHRALFAGRGGEPRAGNDSWSWQRSVAVLAVVSGLLAWMSEILVGAVQPAAEHLGMSQVFLGVIVVAAVGNAAEHSTAVLMALEDRMDLALGVAIGSSVQIALFVAPFLVLISRWIGPAEMNLVFTLPEVLAVALAVFITAQVCGDGESNWLEGVLLLAVYAILALGFYLLPAAL
ncbi:MAG TPA: calcium/proton exchanger, partial [Thermoanaerobaculia bacterium]|nr:calcium/proton exchanger [Thermoanaerobaculia bacterium]